jgi:putative ABC transport system ATP-binding protein
MSAAPPLVDARDLARRYVVDGVGVDALVSASLAIAHGDHVALTGPSGAGKSTLMHLLGCLDRPSAGRYLLDGHDVSTLGPAALAAVRNAKIGFIFQSYFLLPHLSALDNVAMPLVFRGTPPRERRAAAAAMLERVGLADRGHHRPRQLSGGQRQRVAVARALVAAPVLLLADEPTGNLDADSTEAVLQLFDDVNARGVTVVVVTHSEAVAQRCRRRLEVRRGRVSERPWDEAS